MRLIHFIKLLAFAKDNNLTTKSFDDVIDAIEANAKAKGVSMEKYLEDYQ